MAIEMRKGKEETAMRLKGDVLKQIRRKRGLSQTALSEGICTQATISLMEKQNRIPKMNILTAICERLEVDVDELIENDEVSMTTVFEEINNDLVEKNYSAADAKLSQIKVKNLETDFDKQRYYYLLGVLEVAQGKIDEAIFNFELILTQFSTMSANIYWAMTTVGMAKAYVARGNKERALKFVQRAVNLIDEKQLTGSRKQWVTIYRDIASLYMQLGKPEEALKITERGIKICQKDNSMYLLRDYYQLRAEAEVALAQIDAAKDDYQIARSLAKIRNESDVVSQIEDAVQQFA